MNPTRDLERRIADFYATEAPSRAPDWLLTQALDTIETTPQGRTVLGRPWTFPAVTSLAKVAVGAAAVLTVGVVGLTLSRPPSVGPAAELGIFEPVAGRIVSGVWAVDPIAIDPGASSDTTQLRLGSEPVLALGWSSDGTNLLFMREDPADQTFPYAAHLYILHADGSETQLNRDAMLMSGATIAPDGSQVVFAAADDTGTGRPQPAALFVVGAEGGEPVQIAEEGEWPTFSPDGTQIAYLTSNGAPGRAHVWIADADGSDAHEILADEPALVEGVFDLAWSPAGDRIAMGDSLEGRLAIYTFSPDGSDVTKVISGGMKPNWSPDGSRIAYMLPYGEPLGGKMPGLAIANADGSNVREFGLGASGPWHPGTLEERGEAPPSSSPSASPIPSPSPNTPSPAAPSDAERLIAEGTLGSFAATASGNLLTVWDTCHDFGQTDCGFAWRLGEGSRSQATGVVYPSRAVYDSGDVFVPVAAGDGFILAPPIGDETGLRIAQDGTTASLSLTCGEASWSTPTEPGRLVWTTGLNFVDTVAGSICPTSRLGGRALAGGVFTPDGTLWALVDNETGLGTLTIGRYDGTQWDDHDFAALSGSWTSVLAATDSTIAVLLANPEPSPRDDRLVGFAVSTDAGATWSEVVDPDVLERDLPFSTAVSAIDDDWYSGYTSMAFAGPSTLYVADRNGALWRSTDLATFRQIAVPGGVRELQTAGDAVIGRTGDGNDLVRISADGGVERLTVR